MSNNEEKLLQRCKEIIIKIKPKLDKQKNISLEVKNGIKELEEAIDEIVFYRLNQNKIDEELRREKLQEDENALVVSGNKQPASTNSENSGLPENQWMIDRKYRRKQQEREKKDRRSEEITGTYDVSDTEESSVIRKEINRQNHNKNEKLKKKIQRKTRSNALLIKPKEGKSYAEVLGEIRQKANPEELHTEIKIVRQTRAGDILLEFGQNTKDQDEFNNKLKEILGANATVSKLEPKSTLEFRDLDCLTTKEEVEEAIRRNLQQVEGDLKIKITNENSMKLKMAIVQLSERQASKLLETAKIKIGWVYSRIRRRVDVVRCFRCFGYGHQQRDCTGPDRRGDKLCIKCGEKGHKLKECTREPNCFLCKGQNAAVNHVPGSRNCQAFKKALETAKRTHKP